MLSKTRVDERERIKNLISGLNFENSPLYLGRASETHIVELWGENLTKQNNEEATTQKKKHKNT